MAANMYIKRFDIVSADGWVKLSDTSLIVKGQLECLSANISIRYRSGEPVNLRNNGSYPVDGVDLNELEINNPQLSTAGFIVFCQVRS